MKYQRSVLRPFPAYLQSVPHLVRCLVSYNMYLDYAISSLLYFIGYCQLEFYCRLRHNGSR